MAKVITIEASAVWNYYQQHVDELEEMMHEIAGDEEKGVSIYITDNSGKACAVVFVDDEETYRENFLSGGDCENNIAKIYRKYLDETPNEDIVFDDWEGDFEEQYGVFLSEREKDKRIREREIELDVAFEDLMLTLLSGEEGCPDFPDGIEEITTDLKEMVIAYLVDVYGFDIYRPAYNKDEFGEEYYTSYPYRYKDRVFE
ncbi:MAG: hypothetical protein IJF90_05260 [Synergistaceae bacterium]|nr:hypothetical protein [Synergistaceae bacterium]